MSEVAAEFRAWRPAAQVIRHVEAVPTIFPDLDRVWGVGGFPIGRITVLHGPSNEGKTSLLLGLGASFLARDHYFAFIDAERTTPTAFVDKLMVGLREHPGFVAPEKIGFYEDVRAYVREFCETIGNARAKGRLSADVTALIGLDSIRKLVPKKLWEELAKATADTEGKRRSRFARPKGIDGAGGRAGQIKAALNAAWVDELIPLLAETRTAMAIITREELVEDEGDFFSEPKVKVGGGRALNYDASLRLRVSRSWVKAEVDGKKGVEVAECHAVEVLKTKLADKRESVPTGHFYVSNGVLSPAGFDRARDLFDCALAIGVVEQHGSHYDAPGICKLGQGQENAIVALREPTVGGLVEAECRKRFASNSMKSPA